MRLSAKPLQQSVRAGLLSALCLGLLSCATVPPKPATSTGTAPSFRLLPSALGAQIAVQQRLTVSHQGRRQQADALLEIDERALRLVLLAGPKRLLTLAWDGHELKMQREPALPESLQGERFVDDIQLAYWPAEALRAALPQGWTLHDGDRHRSLRYAGASVIEIRYDTATRWLGHIVIDRPGAGYRLSIDSVQAP